MDVRARIEPLDCQDLSGYSTNGATGAATSLSLRQSRGCEFAPPVMLLPDNPRLTNRLPWQTDSTAASSSLPAWALTTYPIAPRSRASCTTSADDSWLRKSILELGASLRICRAAWIPFSFGRPMSSKIKSGFSSSAFCTASNPSEASQMIWNSGVLEKTDNTKTRKGSKSSTTRMRIDSTGGENAFVLVEDVVAIGTLALRVIGRRKEPSWRGGRMRNSLLCF